MKKILLGVTLGVAAGCVFSDWLQAAFEVAKFMAAYVYDIVIEWLNAQMNAPKGTEV